MGWPGTSGWRLRGAGTGAPPAGEAVCLPRVAGGAIGRTRRTGAPGTWGCACWGGAGCPGARGARGPLAASPARAVGIGRAGVPGALAGCPAGLWGSDGTALRIGCVRCSRCGIVGMRGDGRAGDPGALRSWGGPVRAAGLAGGSGLPGSGRGGGGFTSTAGCGRCGSCAGGRGDPGCSCRCSARTGCGGPGLGFGGGGAVCSGAVSSAVFVRATGGRTGAVGGVKGGRKTGGRNGAAPPRPTGTEGRATEGAAGAEEGAGARLIGRSGSSSSGNSFEAAGPASSRRWRSFSAIDLSIELEWVFFSSTPSSGNISRMVFAFTSSSLANSLIRILGVRAKPPLLLYLSHALILNRFCGIGRVAFIGDFGGKVPAVSVLADRRGVTALE
jgi:hypothetical protein